MVSRLFISFQALPLVLLISIIIMQNSPFQQQPGNQDQPEENSPQLTNFLPPANPIITKQLQALEEKVSFKIEPASTDNNLDFAGANFSTAKIDKNRGLSLEPIKKQKPSQNSQTQKTIINEEYSSQNLIYKKYNNEHCNKRDGIKYLTSVFVKKDIHQEIKFPEYVGTVKEDQLQFDSNFESGNLMFVYKKGQNVYDLLLQNDVNTGGLTQWYNFKVKNKRHNFIAKFNIVNLYKSDSLYNKGMKPCVHSERSDKNNKKAWRRKGFNIFYQHNDLAYEENPKKNYKTLSFQYDFTVQNDTLHFSHSMPYDTDNLKDLLEEVKNNNKVTLQTFGVSAMGKPMPLIRIKSHDRGNFEKKVIVILARQHPGQTVGSYICEEIVLELLKNSSENQFLAWRYDFYIVPMVNIDGVSLGNYRGNFAGFDLNRCWEKTDPKLHPEVHAVKALIKKIKKKQQIELILDLHGHSRKMGSFFYGNNFGKNTMLFPYIASKTNSNILFEDSRFSSQRGSKAQTARVVLGKMVRDSGNVYTYEVSFYGYFKNDKSNPFSYNQTHYKDLGKALVLSMYRTYMELYKQQKTLKESVFLKNMKQQIQELKQSTKIIENEEDSGSDSEAEEIMINQNSKLKDFHQNLSLEQESKTEEIVDEPGSIEKTFQKQVEEEIKKQQEGKKDVKGLFGNMYGKQYYEVRNIIKSRFPAVIHHETIKSEEELEEELQQHDFINQGLHPHRLKVYGETYELRSRMAYKDANSHLKIRKDVKNELKTLQNKSSVNSSKDLIFSRKQLMKSLNTINHQRSPNISLSKELKVKQRESKYRNKSLTLKEVTPDFNQNLQSNNSKVHFDRNRIKDQQLKNRIVANYVSRTLKLPQI